MLGLDWRVTLADNDLRKVNRMCALAGVEVCYPLLDDEVLDIALRLPPQLKVKGMTLRFFFKDAMKDFLPQAVLTKSKHGFGLPFGVWMRSHAPLRQLADDSLASLCGRGYIRKDYIERLSRQHRDDHAAYYGDFIWVLMMLELWLQAQGF